MVSRVTPSVKLRFPTALAAWPSAAFSETLKREIEALPPASLPLEQGLSGGNFPADDALSVSVLRAEEDGAFIRVRLGIFFSEINAGCSCGDEPLAQPAYCEFRLMLSRETGEGEFQVLPE